MKEARRYLLIIGGMVIFLLLFIFIISSLFGSKKSTPKKPVTPPKTLVDYVDSDATVSLRIKGVVNGDEMHREIEIIIGRDSRTVNVIQGYQNTVIKNENLYNNQPAFDELLHALNRANFTRERKTTQKNESGVCPLGNRYDLKLTQGGKDLNYLWSSTCSGVGTSAANPLLIIQLFENQIPNYPDFTRDVNLNLTAATSS